MIKPPKQSSYKSYIFIEKRYKIEEVLKHYTKEQIKINFDGHLVNMSSKRYELFKNKGCICSECGREGRFFLLQKSNSSSRNNTYHFGLWSEDLVQMTKDHIVPKSLGGTNTLENFKTMCEICNSKKGNTCTDKDLIEGKIKEGILISSTLKNINSKEYKILKDKIYKFAKELKTNDKLFLKYKKEISLFMSENHINPYLNKDIIPNEILNKITYMENFYLKIIAFANGNISLKNNAFIGLPKSIRQDLIETYKYIN